MIWQQWVALTVFIVLFYVFVAGFAFRIFRTKGRADHDDSVCRAIAWPFTLIVFSGMGLAQVCINIPKYHNTYRGNKEEQRIKKLEERRSYQAEVRKTLIEAGVNPAVLMEDSYD